MIAKGSKGQHSQLFATMTTDSVHKKSKFINFVIQKMEDNCLSDYLT